MTTWICSSISPVSALQSNRLPSNLLPAVQLCCDGLQHLRQQCHFTCYIWTAMCHVVQDQFEQDYTAVQRLAMITNYRSTPAIVAHSSALIACNYQNPGRGSCVPKALQAAPGTEDNPVQFVRYRSKESQGDHILECVKWWHQYGEHWPPIAVGLQHSCDGAVHWDFFLSIHALPARVAWYGSMQCKGETYCPGSGISGRLYGTVGRGGWGWGRGADWGDASGSCRTDT